jgi:hypothetical protein
MSAAIDAGEIHAYLVLVRDVCNGNYSRIARTLATSCYCP